MSFFLLPLVLVAGIWVLIIIGAPVLRHFLPKTHSIQKYLSDESINFALGWVAKHRSKITGWLLVVAFVAITLIYS